MEDRISQLPDPLICQILSNLPTEKSVKTSVLSTRWRTLWLWVSRLELNPQKFPDFSSFVSFGDRFFDSNRVSSMDNLKLIYVNNCVDDGVSHFTSWIDAAVKRKVRRLHVHFRPLGHFFESPISLYMCETLVSLKLRRVALPCAEFFSLPCLKIMHLDYIIFPNEATFEILVSSCPVLEELEILEDICCKAKIFRVFSRSLKRLTICIHFNTGIVIDAPRLRFFTIEDNLSERFIITNMDFNVKLVLHFALWAFHEASLLSQRNSLRSFLPRISKVKDMIIHLDTFQLLCEYSKLERLPQFGHMSRLQVTLKYCHSNWLPSFLENFPNLKFLILVCYDDVEEKISEEMNQFCFSHVPQCLLSSLEFVEFLDPVLGRPLEMKLGRYFLENSAILKKLTLSLDRRASQIQDDFVEKLLKIPRRSTKCNVVVTFFDW